jgi:hypothetical protein
MPPRANATPPPRFREYVERVRIISSRSVQLPFTVRNRVPAWTIFEYAKVYSVIHKYKRERKGRRAAWPRTEISAFDSLAIAERLTKADPSNATWQRDLSVSYGKVSDVLVAQGHLADALASIGQGLAIAERLARSTRDLLNILHHLGEKEIGFKSLVDTWADTTTPHGRLMLTVLGGLAEFERDLIRSRTGEGRKRAMARGVRFGRPPKLTPHQRQEAARLSAGETTTDIRGPMVSMRPRLEGCGPLSSPPASLSR